MGDLVNRHPREQLLAVHLHRARGLGEIGSNQQQARRDGGIEQGEVVLAEHSLGEHARHRPHLRPQQQPAGGAERVVQRPEILSRVFPAEAHAPRRAPARSEPLRGQRLEHRPHRLQVGGDPTGAIDRFQGWQLLGELEAGVLAHAAGELQRQRLHRLAVHLSSGRRPGDQLAHALRGAPVDRVHTWRVEPIPISS